MSVLIKNTYLNGSEQDILIRGNRIAEIGQICPAKADHVIQGRNTAAIPGFINGHTHAAMTFFRGFGDDLPLMEWLETKIWPNESRLSEELVYIGTRLACLEMIRSGTTFFNDMYWHPMGTAKAVTDAGIRAAVNAVMIDMLDPERCRRNIEVNTQLYEDMQKFQPMVQYTLGPHAVYTVSEEGLKWAVTFSERHDVKVHIHLAETSQEVDECRSKRGCHPVQYLDQIGLLNSRAVLAHGVWMDEAEMKQMAGSDVTVVHNPVSNMKLGVGKIFPYQKYIDHGIRVCLGTDGVGSNNSLCMFETMKAAALLQKMNGCPTCLPAEDCLKLAVDNGCDGFNLDCGEIKPGKLADIILVDLSIPEMIPCHDLKSNLVYSAGSGCVTATICNGKVLMENRVIPGERAVIEDFRAALKGFLG